MSNKFVTLNGEFYYARTNAEPNAFDPEKPDNWRVMFRPFKEDLMKVMDLQSLGVKNQLKKDDKGYYINFNRPVEYRGKPLSPPGFFQADGVTPLEDWVGNGSSGELTLELIEWKSAHGKGTSARYHSLSVKNLVPYEKKGG